MTTARPAEPVANETAPPAVPTKVLLRWMFGFFKPVWRYAVWCCVLLAGALVSIGLAISALTANQIVAAAVSLGVFGFLWAIDSLAALLPPPIDNWFLGVSLLARFTPFAVGAMYTSDVGFFLAVILLGLFLTVRALARR